MYTNSNLIEAQLQRDLTASEQILLTTLIPAVDILIDRYTDSHFLEEETATSRNYDFDGRFCDIDPCTGVTALVSIDWDGTTISTYTAGNDYILHPENTTIKTQIEFLSGASLYASIMPTADFPNGRNRIKLTAKFSEYNEGVPEDIQIAATRICTQMIEESSTNSSNADGLKSESIEGYSVTFSDTIANADKIAFADPIVKGILDGRRELLV